MSKYMVYQCDICDKKQSYQYSTIQEMKAFIGLKLNENDNNTNKFTSVPLADAHIHLCHNCFRGIQNTQFISYDPISKNTIEEVKS